MGFSESFERLSSEGGRLTREKKFRTEKLSKTDFFENNRIDRLWIDAILKTFSLFEGNKTKKTSEFATKLKQNR